MWKRGWKHRVICLASPGVPKPLARPKPKGEKAPPKLAQGVENVRISEKETQARLWDHRKNF